MNNINRVTSVTTVTTCFLVRARARELWLSTLYMSRKCTGDSGDSGDTIVFKGKICHHLYIGILVTLVTTDTIGSGPSAPIFCGYAAGAVLL